MGAGIGKMFGIDKIFGGMLDSIGLGALKPLVSTAFDFATGNIPGLLSDLTSLMSKFGSSDFANNVSKNQPLPDAFNSDNSYNNTNAAADSDRTNDACNTRDANNDLSSNRIGQLFKLLSDIFNSKDSSEIKDKMTQLFKLLSENANNRESLQSNRTNVQFFSGGVTISA
jgi:hypothetical protein